jgi:uncharacterized protein
MADAEATCMRCGACCASYRVSFYWTEAADAPGDDDHFAVPVAHTEPVDAYRRCMKVVDWKSLRCVCLTGVVGEQVACAIYANRPSPCREFHLHGEHGIANPRCNEARAKHGLPQLA